jgi:hypothetical protein
MSDTVKVRAENGDIVDAPRAFAESKGLDILDSDDDERDSDQRVRQARTLNALAGEKVRVKLADGSEATVAASFAAAKELTVLDKKAVDGFGRALNSKPHIDLSALKGAALDEALEKAGLSKSGTADEKRARLAEYQASGDGPA